MRSGGGERELRARKVSREAIAAGQRGYFSLNNVGCSQGATMAVTILAGPLNYLGFNPMISCSAPKPSGA